MKQHLLDNPFLIQKLDPQDMLGHVEGAVRQCRDARNKAFNKKLNFDKSKIDALLICGVGGSAISGETLAVYLRQTLKIPVVVNRLYDLPAWVNSRTLVVCSSYSGDTEETLAAFQQVLSRKLNTVIISSGGTLLKEARKRGLPFYEMPAGVQPRAMIYYSFITLLTLLESLKIIPSQAKEVGNLISSLEKITFSYSVSRPLKNNLAKQLAVFFHKKNPVVYSNEGFFSAAAYRWKCQFNENSKQMAWANVFSEMNHNEILSYTHKDMFVKTAAVLLLRSKKYDNARISKRFDIFKKMVSLRTKNIKEVWVEDSSLLSQTLSIVYLGDFVSVYLALLKKMNPTSIELIDQLKTDLKK